MLEIRVLGPLEVRRAGAAVALGGRVLPALLAILALSAGRPVPYELLIERLWADQRPREPRQALHTYVSRLRATLGAGLIDTASGGYVLRVPPDRVDALLLRDLVERADTHDALTQALALWRDTPFAGSVSDWLREVEAERLVGLYLRGVERRVELDLARGGPPGLAEELHALTDRFPLRESLWALRMRTLQHAGRTAEAIELYGIVRALIADRLGVEPGTALQQVFTELLAQDGAATDGAGEDGTAREKTAVVPRQLPLPRRGHVARPRLLEALDGGDLIAVHGPGGVGKTSLVVQWAHRARDRFPEGQLFIDLQGHGPAEPVPARAALGEMLRALAVPPRQVPDELSERGALLRSVTAGRRLLIVLDNARDSGHVRPLLPGAGPTVIVTSRTSLSGLAAREGAHRVALKRLSDAEAAALLAAELEGQGVAHDRDTLGEIARLCDGLPLALTIVAERAARTGPRRLARVVADLRAEQSRLDLLHSDEDPLTSVRAALSTSYEVLDPSAARVFRAFGLHPGPDLSAAAVVALSGAEAPLDALTDANLVEEHQRGRYRMHDLVRLYAAELSTQVDPRADPEAVLDRWFSWYLHSAASARHAIGHQESFAAYDDTADALTFTDSRSALAWFTGERRNLVAVVRDAARRGLHRIAYTITLDLWPFLNNQQHVDDAFALLPLALRAAEAAGERSVSAALTGQLADTYSKIGAHDRAIEELERAAGLWTLVGDDSGVAATLCAIGRELLNLTRFADALVPLRKGLDLVGRTARDDLRARLMNNVAMSHVLLGQFQEAVDTAVEALALPIAPWIEPYLLDTLGQAHTGQGAYEEAGQAHQRALYLIRDHGDRWVEPYMLHHLGLAERGRGNAAEARSAWQTALRIMDEFQDSAWPNRPEVLRLVAELDERFADSS